VTIPQAIDIQSHFILAYILPIVGMLLINPASARIRRPPADTSPLCPLYELSSETLAAVELFPGVAAAPGLAGLHGMMSRIGRHGELFSNDAFLCAHLGLQELTDPAAPGRIASLCEAQGVASQRFCFFFTDTLCHQQGMRAIEQFLLFKRFGFRLGIDIDDLDQAPGPFIEMLPADVLRLGALDTMTRTSDPDSAGELLAFTRFAENLLMIPAASGVQSRGQLNTLRSLGMRFGQGPLFPVIPITA